VNGSIVIFDCEFTSWEDARETFWGGPGQQREIIQIAARRWTKGQDWRKGETFLSFVRPQINPKLSGFIQNLTGVRQRDVAKASTVDVVMKQFARFAKGAHCYSNGNDINAIAENFGLLRKVMPLDPAQMRTLYPWIQQSLEKARGPFNWQNYSSGRMYKLLKLKLPTNNVHDAMHDVDSLCATIEALGQREVRIGKLWK